MAQHPEKLKWKDKCSFGLSASQFGMALGFCGRVVDYVDYLRNVVGTELEFRGNRCTEHGIMLEPKARALYEMLTGVQVFDGGFFLTQDQLLGCSPDGRSYYYEAASGDYAASSTADIVGSGSSSDDRLPSSEPSGRYSLGSCNEATPSSTCPRGVTATRCAVTILFRQKRDRVRDEQPSGTRSSPRSTVLQGGLDPEGQSAACAATSGRVTRCRKLRLLEIKSPFRALYDCLKSGYQPFGIPLQYMCQLQGQMAIADAEECDFFVYLDQPNCQVEAWRVKRCAAFWSWALPKLRQVIDWVRDGPPPWLNRSFAFESFNFSIIEVKPLVFPFDITLGTPLADHRRFAFFAQHQSPYGEHNSTPRSSLPSVHEGNEATDRSEMDRIAHMVRSRTVRFLFANNGETLPTSLASDEKARVAALQPLLRRITFTLSAQAQQKVMDLLSSSAWNTLCAISTAEYCVTEGTVWYLTSPTNWEAGDVMLCTDSGPVRRVRTFHRDFFAAVEDLCQGAMSLSEIEESHEHLDAHVITAHTSEPRSMAPTFDLKAMGSDSVPALGSATGAFCSNGVSPLKQSAKEGTPPKRSLTPVVIMSPSLHETSPSLESRIRYSLSPAHIRKSKSMPPHIEGVGEHCAARGPIIGAEDQLDNLEIAPQGLMCVVGRSDLLELVQFADDCKGVSIVSTLATPPQRYHRTQCDLLYKEEDTYTLLIGPQNVLDKLVHSALGGPDHYTAALGAYVDLYEQLRACVVGNRIDGKGKLVLCFVLDHTEVACVGRGVWCEIPAVPCLVINNDDWGQLRREVEEAVETWQMSAS